MPFNYNLDFHTTDFRKNPELYHIGKGEQGVLLVQPYKGEILPYWRFKTPEIAQESADKIYDIFLEYLGKNDFVGADMARKFLQMGYTRSRRYANHKSGKKYADSEDEAQARLNLAQQPYPYSSGSRNKGNKILPLAEDAFTNEKAQSAQIFYQKWQQAKNNLTYKAMAQKHIEMYGK